MSKANALTDADRERIAQLHQAGQSAGYIARDLGRARSTVTRAAKAMGLTWDAAQTAAATEVKQASNRERRAAAVQRLYTRAERILDRLDADTFKLIGLDKYGNARTNHIDADAIPGAEERALAGMAVNLLTAAARLEAVDAATTQGSEAKGILGALGDALQGAYGQLAHTGGTATAEDVERDLDTDPETR